jgi:predicted nucleotidyltransferase
LSVIVGTKAIKMQRTERCVRAFLITEAVRFIDRAVSAPGVKKIAIVGSLTTGKADPKDADILVTVDDDADLTALATAARKLKGAAQTRNKGADVFLANPRSQYIGRICHWRECGPGIRTSCDAQHRGGRHYLHDDLDDVTLDPLLVKEPPIEVWPTFICRTIVPDDLLLPLSRFQ